MVPFFESESTKALHFMTEKSKMLYSNKNPATVVHKWHDLQYFTT